MSVATLEHDIHPYTVDEAFTFCGNITVSHYENFPVASLFLPEEKRPYIQAIYAFSRIADDFADESDVSPKLRLANLQHWEEMLGQCYQGEATHPVFIALRETITRQNIPIDPLRDLIAAFKRDVTQNRYESFEDVLSYCRCSANPVGRLVLMIFGYHDENMFKLSDAICTALQLTNFWQDVRIDLKKDRLYIPLEDMHRFGYPEEMWKSEVYNDSFRKMLEFEAERTKDLFYAGAELPALVGRDLQVELRLVWFGGMSILRKIKRVKYDVFHQRPVLSIFSKAMVLIRTLLISDLTRYGKRRKPWDLT